MTDDRLTRLARLFERAVALPADERADFVDREARDQADRDELLRLIVSDEHARDFLDRPALDQLGAQGLAEPIDPIGATVPAEIGGYAIERSLGSGSMGDVFLARQERTEQAVAVKLLRAGPRGAATLRRFEREMRILGRLQHSGIARILDAGYADLEGGRRPFFALEFVDGRDLVEHATAVGADLSTRVDLLVQLCAAVEHAHGQGVVHRDLKPDNVLVNADGRVKVLDFGVARAADPDLELTTLRTQELQIIGTLAYMSPEQAAGDVTRVDAQSDVYAIGAIAYELLGKRRPHDLSGLTVVEAARVVQEEDPDWLDAVAPSVPRDLALVVHTAMAKDLSRRYRSAAELGADLGRWLRHEPVTARPPSTIYTLKKFALRHRGLTTGLGVSAAVLIAATVVSLLFADRAVRASERSSWQKYLATLAAASAEIQMGSVRQARDRLATAPPTFRGVEWNALWNLADQSRLDLPAHVTHALDVAVTADGERAFTCGADWAVRLWDLDDGEELHVLEEHGAVVDSVATSPDGSRMASASQDGVIRLRDARTLETIAILTRGMGKPMRGLAFSDDGRLLASGAGDGELLVWSARDGAMLQRLAGHEEAIWDLEFAPGGDRLASGSADGSARLWDARSGIELARFDAGSETVRDLAFSRDGRRLALVCSRTGGDNQPGDGIQLQVWDVTDQRIVVARSVSDFVPTAIAFAARDRLLVTGREDGRMDVWDASTLEPKRSLEGHAARVTAIEASADGATVVSTGHDASVRVWDAGRLDERTLPWTHDVRGTIAVGGAARSTFVARSDGRVVTVDALTGEVLSEVGLLDAPYRLVADDEGRRLAAPQEIGQGRRVRVIDTATGALRADVPGSSYLALSPDGSRLATTAGPTGEAFVYDAGSGALLTTLATEVDAWCSAIAFDHTGERVFVAGFADQGVRVHDAETGRELAVLRGIENMTLTIARDAQGARLLTGGHERVAIVWDATTLEEVGRLADHGSSVTAAAFHPGGRRIATGTRDGKVRIWSADSFELFAVFSASETELQRIEFTSDGELLVLQTRANELLVLDARPVDVD